MRKLQLWSNEVDGRRLKNGSDGQQNEDIS